MHCSRCLKSDTKNILKTQLYLESYKINGRIYRIDCKMCNNFMYIKADDDLLDINALNENVGSYWKMVQSNREKIVYYVLCQIIYPEIDTPMPDKWESLYDFADESDQILIKWKNGKAIGFYTVKPKGIKNLLTNEEYSMNVIDTAYIRSEYRHQGYGLEMIKDIVARFPNDDLGFSKPISLGMQKVLKKFLRYYKEYRRNLWEISDHDINGSQQLIWLNIKNRNL